MESDGFEQLKNQIQEWLQEAEKLIHQKLQTQLHAAIGVVLLTALLILLVRWLESTKGNTIVLTGLSGSGRTVLYYQKEKIKPVHIVDVPGHSRLRPKLDEFLPQAAGIVFVVDALEFLPNCRVASEYVWSNSSSDMSSSTCIS